MATVPVRRLLVSEDAPSGGNIPPRLHAAGEARFGRLVSWRLSAPRIAPHAHAHAAPLAARNGKYLDQRVAIFRAPAGGKKHFAPILSVTISLAIVGDGRDRELSRAFLQACGERRSWPRPKAVAGAGNWERRPERRVPSPVRRPPGERLGRVRPGSRTAAISRIAMASASLSSRFQGWFHGASREMGRSASSREMSICAST